jgi:hypothetical protein
MISARTASSIRFFVAGGGASGVGESPVRFETAVRELIGLVGDLQGEKRKMLGMGMGTNPERARREFR